MTSTFKENGNPYESPAADAGMNGTPSKRHDGPSLRNGVICCSLVTLLYWVWESQAGGNIRVDLVFGYPLLFGLYIYFLQRLRWLSVVFAFALMAANYCFFVISYSVFNKPLG